jgi:hypothetical protein
MQMTSISQRFVAPQGYAKMPKLWLRLKIVSRPDETIRRQRRLIIQQDVALSKLRCMQSTRNDPAYPQRRSWVRGKMNATYARGGSQFRLERYLHLEAP